MSFPKPGFSVRIVVCDHYLARPIPGVDVIYSEFRGSDIKQVPVLRIFGPALDGHKTCLHVHGVFPYFYIPCPSPNPEPQFLYQIALSLDKALNIALKQASSANHHVYKITLVKGLPFYGFHDKEHLYLKVFLYNPGLIKQAVELCSNGAILGQAFQPHESHLNFTLQFFIDFNLFGMSNIDLQMVNLRKRPGTSQNSNDPSDDELSIKPESICYYEADCIASHIINRQRIGRGDGIENPGLEEVWNQEKERRKQLNMSIASKSLSQARLRDTETESHYKFEQIVKIKLSGLVTEPVNTEVQKTHDHYYPAESIEGTQLYSAVDVSMHLPENSLSASFDISLRQNADDTLIGDPDTTLVNLTGTLNNSLRVQYSQVSLDNEDMDLLDVLKDMDEKSIEEDSVMGTPADEIKCDDEEFDDAEYSQIFHEETVLIDAEESKGEDASSESWNDSFWEGANIPQLDGTFDDDHVKKVRKRKMRPFKLGLSRPKAKKTEAPILPVTVKNEPVSNQDISIPDEINESRETVHSVSSSHLKKSIKVEQGSATDTDIEASQASNLSITDLVYQASAKYGDHKLEPAKSYDLEHKYEPKAGPSTSTMKTENYSNNCPNLKEDLVNDSFESSPESRDLGFISFYDRSKIFDCSIDNYDDEVNHSSNEVPNGAEDVKMEVDDDDNKLEIVCPVVQPLTKDEQMCATGEDIKLVYSDSTQESETKPILPNKYILTPKFRPPSYSYVLSSLEKYNIPKTKAPEPYYSNHRDVGDKVEIGHMTIKLHSKLAKDQKPNEKVIDTTSIEEWRQLLFLERNDMTDESSKPENLKSILACHKQCILEPILKPPTRKDVIEWLENKDGTVKENRAEVTEVLVDNDLDNSQAIGLNDDEINSSISLDAVEKDQNSADDTLQITMQPDGSFLCFGTGESQKETPDAPVVEINYLTMMLIEVHTVIRGDYTPDPLLDPIQAAFLTITNDCPTEHFLEKSITEIIVVDPMPEPKYFDRCLVNMDNVKLTYVDRERDLLDKVIESIRKHDPDIMCGYEIETRSWGYFLERSEVLGLEIVMEVSRITEKYRQKRWKRDENDFEGRILGRILFNVWRLFRHELALSSYSFENCMNEILKERVPKYSYGQLAEWWSHESRLLRWIPVEHYLARLSGTVRMLEKLDMINRTAELARLFGLQWWEVLSRGSQFRVESLMLRAARPLNLVALSPTVKQRAAMRAPEFLPLIFEPQSRFYADPVIVLDFQSLYPSMMIAYNYCFSTCIGRAENITGDTSYEFGAWRLRIPKAKLEALISGGLVHFSPAGVGFVSPTVRRGVLPALLRRILAARQAVKGSMKKQTDPQVKKAMHSRQLGLKLIANVTYGYTAANFSGRMPCVEVGDSVVAKGRETLERAVKLVERGSWNAKVVYGDTDSMFVLVPGGTRSEAFRIGQEIADAVTADNPSPVALKLEKVYQPCILQTKKRYVGYMYESAAQEAPVYEAKGIETVRRDGCPAGVKLLQRALCELFSTSDMSRVKRVVMATLGSLVDGSLPPQELFFTREYHGAAHYRPGTAAPPLEIAKRLVSRDRRAGPRTGERVAWLVTAGAPGLPLVKLARSPQELLKAPQPPHVAYYAARVLLPPLHRCLSLLGVDVFKWWSELGYVREIQLGVDVGSGGGIARYLRRGRCALCGARTTRSLCAACAARPQPAAAALLAPLRPAAARRLSLHQICTSCAGHSAAECCENAECPATWRRQAARRRLADVQDIIRQAPPHLQCSDSLDF